MNENKGQTIFLSVIGIATLLVAIIGATFAYFSLTVTGNDTASSIIVTTAVLGNITFEDGNEISMLNVNLPQVFDASYVYLAGDTSTETTMKKGLTKAVLDAEIATDTTHVDYANVIGKTFTVSNDNTEGVLTNAVDYYIYLVIGDDTTFSASNDTTDALVYSIYGVNTGEVSGDTVVAEYVDGGTDSGIYTVGIVDAPKVTLTANTTSKDPYFGGTAIQIGKGTFAQGTTGNEHTYHFGVAVLNKSTGEQNSIQGKSFVGLLQVSTTNAN